MRLLFYLIIFSQFLSSIDLFAEKVIKSSTELNPIIWKKVREKKSNNLKKIIWKSFKDDERYFQNKNGEVISDKKIINIKDTNLNTILEKDEALLQGGLTVENALIPKRGKSQLSLNYDSKGGLFSSYKYSLSNIFQFQLISGSHKGNDSSSIKNSDLRDTYLNNDNLNYLLGGKILLLSPQNSNLFWLSSRFTLGRDFHSRQDHFFLDLTSTFKIFDKLGMNINPKFLFSEIDNLTSLGISNFINFSKNLIFIAETNIGLDENSENNYTFSLRHLQNTNRTIDFYISNAVGIEDIGQLLRSDNYKFGIKVGLFF